MVALCVAGYAFIVWKGAPGWALGAYGTRLATFAGLSAASYVLALRASFAMLRTMNGGAATLRLSDGAFEVESAAGRAELPWTAVASVETAPEVSLVFYTSPQFSSLPPSDLTAEARAFVADRVVAAGGTVRVP